MVGIREGNGLVGEWMLDGRWSVLFRKLVCLTSTLRNNISYGTIFRRERHRAHVMIASI